MENANELAEAVARVIVVLDLYKDEFRCAEVGVCYSGFGEMPVLLVRYTWQSAKHMYEGDLFKDIYGVSENLRYKLYASWYGAATPQSEAVYGYRVPIGDVIATEHANAATVIERLYLSRPHRLWIHGSVWDRLKLFVRLRTWAQAAITMSSALVFGTLFARFFLWLGGKI